MNPFSDPEIQPLADKWRCNANEISVSDSLISEGQLLAINTLIGLYPSETKELTLLMNAVRKAKKLPFISLENCSHTEAKWALRILNDYRKHSKRDKTKKKKGKSLSSSNKSLKHQKTPKVTGFQKASQQNHRYLQTKYQTYLNSPEWREKAESAKERAGQRCQLCNRPRGVVRLNAHHRTYERVGHELPDDITVLCDECHEIFEMNSKNRPRDVFDDKARTTCDGCNASYEKWRLTKVKNMYFCPKCVRDIPMTNEYHT